MQKISSFLWFDDQAEEADADIRSRRAEAEDLKAAAVKCYTGLFKNSKTGRMLRYNGEAAEKTGRQVGSVLTIEFEIEGQKFVALNGGPLFKFNESISFVVNCETQEEVDYFWEKLTADGGEESACGWLKDKFGLSWQITPTVLIDMLHDADQEKSGRVMQAMFQMKRIDIKALEDACER